MTLHATITPRKLVVENFLKKFPGTQKTPTTRNEWWGFCCETIQCPAIPNAEHLHYQNATMAPTPHKRDEGHEKSRQNIFAQVVAPTAPSAFRPCLRCQRITAALVFAP